MSNLQNEIGSLSAAEKFELLDILWESLEGDAQPLTEAQRTELDYRTARYERKPSEAWACNEANADLSVMGAHVGAVSLNHQHLLRRSRDSCL